MKQSRGNLSPSVPRHSCQLLYSHRERRRDGGCRAVMRQSLRTLVLEDQVRVDPGDGPEMVFELREKEICCISYDP